MKFLKAPNLFSHLNTATFVFQVLAGGNVSTCTNCSINCKVSSILELVLFATFAAPP